MTREAFLIGSGRVLICSSLLALALWFGLGERWFGFYGAASVALITLAFLAPLLWRRLRDAGRSRWLIVAGVMPLLLIAAGQILYWVLFFETGPTNPSLGVIRAMALPWLAAAQPWVLLALAAIWALILGRSLRLQPLDL